MKQGPTHRRTEPIQSRLLAGLVSGALILLGIACALPAAASADAANPLATTTGSEVMNPNGTVTVTVHGNWTWSDMKCWQRYGVGWAVDWWGVSTKETPSLDFSLSSASEIVSAGAKGKEWSQPKLVTGSISPIGSLAINTNPAPVAPVPPAPAPPAAPKAPAPPAPAPKAPAAPPAGPAAGPAAAPAAPAPAVAPAPPAPPAAPAPPTPPAAPGAAPAASNGTTDYFHVPAYYAGEDRNLCEHANAEGAPTGAWSAEATYPSVLDVPAELCVNLYDEHGSEGVSSNNANDFSPIGDGDNSIQTNDYDPVTNHGYCLSSVSLLISEEEGEPGALT